MVDQTTTTIKNLLAMPSEYETIKINTYNSYDASDRTASSKS
jgi:hypothetical protein